MNRLTSSLKGIISFLIAQQGERFSVIVAGNYSVNPGTTSSLVSIPVSKILRSNFQESQRQ